MWLLQAVNEVLTNVEVEVGAHKGACSRVPRPDPPEKEGPDISTVCGCAWNLGKIVDYYVMYVQP